MRLLDEPVYTLEEIAAWLRVEPSFLLSECRRGRLLLRRMGSMLRCRQSDLERYLETRCLPRRKAPISSSSSRAATGTSPGPTAMAIPATKHGHRRFRGCTRILNRTLSNPVRKDDGPRVPTSWRSTPRQDSQILQPADAEARHCRADAGFRRPAGRGVAARRARGLLQAPRQDGKPIAPTGRARQLTVLRAALNYARREAPSARCPRFRSCRQHPRASDSSPSRGASPPGGRRRRAPCRAVH